MAKGARGGKYGGGGNTKYNGFSVTVDGNTENYIVINGIVGYADGRADNNNTLLGSQLLMMQNAYNLEGSTSGVIQRINNVGIGVAKTLPDKTVEKMQKARKKQRAKSQKQQDIDAYKRKKGVNRHRANWSAM